MKQKKSDFNIVFKNSALILLFFIINTLIITNLLFFINVTITAFHVPISFCIAIIELVLLFKNKISIKNIFLSILLVLAILTIIIIFAEYTYDLSWDGNAYHKVAIGSLKNGWNPVYESVETFTIENGNKIDVGNKNGKWVDHYPKASWIFSANIYKITENIETAKILNALMMYICFVLAVSYLNKKTNKIWATIIALLVTMNPIAITQIFNYYVDGLQGTTLTIILLSLIAITEKKLAEKPEQDKLELQEYFTILANSIILIVNLKFTGLVYAAFFCFVFYMFWLYKAVINKDLKNEFIKNTRFYVVVVLIAIVIVGYSPYINNTIKKGHPFYPLFGENKIDIITMNQPYSFRYRNVVEKFIISMFSEGDNIHETSGGSTIEEPKFKIPFTINENEIKEYSAADLRISRIWTVV